MSCCLGKKSSSSVYLLPPKDSPGLSSCNAEWCSQSASGKHGDDLDHSRPTDWLNDLVRDQVADRASRSKSPEKPLHAGDIAAVERTLQVSSCALILGLLYAERLQVAEEARPQPSVVGEDRPDQPAAPAPATDDSTPESPENTDDNATSDDPDESRYSITAADLFLVCVLTANKYLYDEGEPDSVLNGDMAHAGRRKAKKINELERIFLRRMDWKLYVREEEFTSFLKRLERTLTVRVLHTRNGELLYQDAYRLWDVIASQGLVALSVLGRVCALVAAMYGVLALAFVLGTMFPVSVPAVVSTHRTQNSSQCAMPFTTAQVPIFAGQPQNATRGLVMPSKTVYRHHPLAAGCGEDQPRHAIPTCMPGEDFSHTGCNPIVGRQQLGSRTTRQRIASFEDLPRYQPDSCSGHVVFDTNRM